GITISPVQARMARARAAANELASQVAFEVMDANELDFPKESFDLIWIVECLEHLNDKPAFLQACSRVLRPAGVIAICSWAVGEAFEKDKHETLLNQVCQGMLLPSLPTIAEYDTWLRKCGFIDIKARDVSGLVSRTWTHCLEIVQNP